MEKCVNCQYYDRQNGKPSEGRAPQWGQCRRSAPMLNPLNSKTYMIEGVWPTVRDDDWCGEWKIMLRRVDVRTSDQPGGPLFPNREPALAPTPRAGPLTSGSLMSSLTAPSVSPLPPATAAAIGLGDD